jgi:hypothetical protein
MLYGSASADTLSICDENYILCRHFHFLLATLGWSKKSPEVAMNTPSRTTRRRVGHRY